MDNQNAKKTQTGLPTRFRIGIFAVIVLPLFGTFLLAFAGYYNSFFSFLLIRASAILSYFIAIGIVIYAYLTGTIKLIRSILNKDATQQHSWTSEDIEKEKKRIEMEQVIKKLELADPDLEMTEEELRFEKLLNEHPTAINYKYSHHLLEDDKEEIRYGLRGEIRRTERNATINLIVGILTTASAVAILIYTLLVDGPTKKMDTSEILQHYIPRVSLSVFVEIFSFFFLRLYRKNQDDMKYLTNELTNINMKILAFNSAFYINEKDLIKPLLEELSKTERNFILKKDETTRDLQKLTIERDEQAQLFDKLVQIFKSK